MQDENSTKLDNVPLCETQPGKNLGGEHEPLKNGHPWKIFTPEK